ncbi:HlyD family efflux transporter periplasmic adaptor subunit, partial [Paramagnetospirillum marisnigri]|uniref:HlyD family efflux transporter periplasmic adaptor subunit n=1 Tax=Paramagnetospirillum marisnigri TaxID=1285242 RepID=UPI0012E77BC2
MVALSLPWHGRVSTPAMMKAEVVQGLYPAAAGRIERMMLTPGLRVTAGTPIVVLSSPDLEYRLSQVERRIRILEYELASYSFDAAFRERSQALQKDLEGAVAERMSSQREQVRLTLVAPFDGHIVDPNPDFHAGQWIGPRDRMASLEGDGAPVIDAYVDERDVSRLKPGGPGRFCQRRPNFPHFGRTEIPQVEGSVISR